MTIRDLEPKLIWEQFDDITMLCLTWHGPCEEEANA